MSFWNKPQQKIAYLSQYLAKPHILFYALPWLMILLVLGTVTQKNLGLYAATEKYFNSYIAWIGPIPTPGGLTTLGVILAALTIKFIFYSPWQWNRAGTILTHLGILLLLIGSIVTATTAREGFMIIPEGKSVDQISDYRTRVLNFYNDDKIIKTIAFNDIQKNKIIEIENLEIKILDKCNNCDARAPSGLYENLQDLAVNMEIFSVPDDKNIEANFSGLTLELKQGKDTQTGTYIVMEDIPRNPILKSDTGDIEIKLERFKTPLPFAIHLEDFRKIDYPGTLKARKFESDLIVKDDKIEWPASISMNKPLRYKGYTFYQSSFDQIEGVEISVLNIVENKGRIFPYIATLIIFIGLLLHFVIRVTKFKTEDVPS